MEKLTLLETLQIVLNIIFSSDLLLFIVGFMLLAIGTFLINKRTSNKKIYILIILSWFLFTASIVSLIAPKLFQIIEVVTQELLKQYYFPNLAVLFFMFIVTYIIGISSFFKFKRAKVISIINQIFFAIMNILFSCLMYHAIEKNLDLTLGMFLYKDKQTLAILEMITFIFSIWFGFNLICLLAKYIANKITGEKELR